MDSEKYKYSNASGRVGPNLPLQTLFIRWAIIKSSPRQLCPKQLDPGQLDPGQLDPIRQEPNIWLCFFILLYSDKI